jgi:hypothetical protein
LRGGTRLSAAGRAVATPVDGRFAALDTLLLRPDGRIMAVGSTVNVVGTDGSIGPMGMILFDRPG